MAMKYGSMLGKIEAINHYIQGRQISISLMHRDVKLLDKIKIMQVVLHGKCRVTDWR